MAKGHITVRPGELKKKLKMIPYSSFLFNLIYAGGFSILLQ
jgi:hypothetical protein